MGNYKQILYFDKSEKSNSDEMVKFAVKRLEEGDVKNVVVVWSSGYTMTRFLEASKGLKLNNVIAVTNPGPHSPQRGMMPVVVTDRDNPAMRKMKEDMIKKGVTETFVSISDEKKAELEKQGAKVVYLVDWFDLGEPLALTSSWSSRRDIAARFGIGRHVRPLDIDAGTDLSLYTCISQGVRVCVGCSIVAVHNGALPEGELTLALGGRSTGIILQSGATGKTTIIKEILGFERGSSHYERDPEHPEGD